MPGYGYSYVTDSAFIAFGQDLSEGAWGEVSIAKYDKPDQHLGASALELPQPVLWKLQIAWSLATLKLALGSTALDERDGNWDSTQRRLSFQLAAAAEAKDAGVREAAQRLQALLLHGGGTGQTGFEYDDEVDFGRRQLVLTAEGEAAEDVRKLDLGETMKDIHETTEALAQGLGRTAGGKRKGAPSIRQREALVACSAAFNSVHGAIAWFVEHTPGGAAKDKLLALQAPFDALLARNPAPAAAGKGAAGAPVTVTGTTTAAAATATTPATPVAPIAPLTPVGPEVVANSPKIPTK